MAARDVDDRLQSMGFTIRHSVAGRESVAQLFPRDRRRGIYVLHFANGQHYVGQSVEVVRRYGDHRRNHPDIAEISFREVPQDALDTEEE
ncbi:MAG: hypothetical protein IT305_18265 [Chloroflexi bacterium]|nr:hypothetical protein [Chloroflexota bacterium]